MTHITENHYKLHLGVLRKTLEGLIVVHGARVPKSYLYSLLLPATEEDLRHHMEFLCSHKSRDEWEYELAARQPSLLPEEEHMLLRGFVADSPERIVSEDPTETEPDMGYTR